MSKKKKSHFKGKMSRKNNLNPCFKAHSSRERVIAANFAFKMLARTRVGNADYVVVPPHSDT
jgi:hypothetical protein